MSDTTNRTFKKLPGVLSLSRGFVITDAELFNEIDGDYEMHPVKVIRHGIRGTQNVNKEVDPESATTRESSVRPVSNIQQTDSAKLDPQADALVARFSYRPLPFDGEQRMATAPDKKQSEEEVTELRESIERFIERSKDSEGLAEVGRRVARNIVNGRWLWRNRTVAAGAEIRVYRNTNTEAPRLADMEPEVVVDATTVPLNHFDGYSDEETRLGAIIADNFAGKRADTLIVEARLTFGMRGAIEVFPSQNYIENKPTGFARPLYRLGIPEKADPGRDVQVMGNAALRDQKIGNALRTFDTWYADFETWGKPIAIEPNGANLEAQKQFRERKTSAFKLFTRFNEVSPDSAEGMFMLGCLIRGGVYSEGA